MTSTPPRADAQQASAEVGLPRVQAETARAILEGFEPSEEAVALADGEMAPSRYLELLFKGELFEDAVTFLAYGLPSREALWWGLGVVRTATPAEAPPELGAALEAVQTWIDDPQEEHRRAAMEAAEAATYGTPAGCLALAVFFSGGSIAPPDCPDVPVEEGFCARTTAAAILLATLRDDPEAGKQAAKDAALGGVEVARGRVPWEADGEA